MNSKIFTSRPKAFRTRTDAGPFGPVHIAQDWIGGPKPKVAFCGVPVTDGTGGSWFDGWGGVICHTCGDAMDAMAGDHD